MTEEKNNELSYMTIIIAAENVLVFGLLSLTGDLGDGMFMIGHGALYPPLVIDGGEWYRLVSSTFLHFTFQHLVNNMVMLLAVGSYVERNMNRIAYLGLYLASGIVGNLLSLRISLMSGNYGISAGASGAIFGLVGALLAIALKNGGKVDGLKIQRILLMIALMVFATFTESGVDYGAHIGGLVAGFVLGMILYTKKEIPHL